MIDLDWFFASTAQVQWKSHSGFASSSSDSFSIFYCWEKKAKACGYQRRLYQKTLGVSLPKFDFGPRSHLVRTLLKTQPIKTQRGKVLERLCNGLSDQRCAMAKWTTELLA